MGWNARTFVTQGLSFARGTTIDEYLSAKDCAALYEKWQKDWPELYRFRGGITAITCEMVLEVPEAAFRKVYGGRGNEDRGRPDRILEIARRNAGR